MISELIGKTLGIVFGFMITSTLTTYVGAHILTWLEIMP